MAERPVESIIVAMRSLSLARIPPALALAAPALALACATAIIPAAAATGGGPSQIRDEGEGARIAAPEPDHSADTAALDEYLEEELARSPIPGLAVAVTHGDEIILLAGYGTAGDGEQMTPHTPMRIASLSKSFTAVAVLQLVEAGVLDLDDPVHRHVPELDREDPAGLIPVRHLLNQTGGLADRSFQGLWDLEQDNPAERVDSLAGAELIAPPGARFHYSNPNYEILARVVEVASGTDFNDYLEHQIFEPLDMGDSAGVMRAEQAGPRVAQGHIVAFGVPFALDEPLGYLGGSGGVVSTAADLARALIMYGNEGALDGRQILSSESVSLAQTPPEDVDSGYAMGWLTGESADQRTVEHDGVLATSAAQKVILPDTGHGIVLLSNAGHAFNDLPRIKEGMVALLTGEEPPASPITHRRLAWLLGALIVVGLVVRARQFARRGAWARQSTRRSTAVTWLSLGRLLVPALLLAGLPTLFALAGDRVFPHRLLLLASPEIVVWLGVATVTGLALALARFGALRDARVRR